jgi:hypothetical protein
VRHEVEREVSPVEIARKVEEVHLDQRLLLIERRSAPHVRHRIVCRIAEQRAPRVDSLGRQRLSPRRREVRRREAQAPTAPRPLDHLARDPVRAAQESRRLRHVARGPQLPDARAADRPVAIVHRRPGLYREPEPAPERDEVRHRARAIAAEAKVGADPYLDQPVASAERAHELLGAHAGDRRRERPEIYFVDAQLADQPHSLVDGRERPAGPVGPQHLLGVGVERDTKRASA